MMNTVLTRMIGGACLAFGVPLAVLTILAVEIRLRDHDAPFTGALIPLILMFLVSVFLLLAGCRLLFNRPTRSGSILSPMGWKVLATAFNVACVVSFAEAASKQNFSLLAVAAGWGLLGYGCLIALRIARRGVPTSQTFPADTSLLSKQGFLPAGFLHGIEILNDDRTPMEFVVSILQSHVQLNRPDAIKAMLDIHEKGGKLFPLQSFEHATKVADLIVNEASALQHPLTCRAVRVNPIESA